jgi:tRNA nucleotidyltransferase (CCA-adding enzyme)
MQDSIRQAATLGCKLSEDLRPSELVQCLQDLSETALVTTWLIHQETEHAREALDAYIRIFRYVKPHADGQTLKELGLPPGPCYTAILWRLRQAWLDGELDTQAAEEKLMQELVSEYQADD